MFDRFRSVRRAWFWLAVAHLATLAVLVIASLWRVAPSTISFFVAGQVSLLGVWMVMGKARLMVKIALAVLGGVALMTVVYYGLPDITGGSQGLRARWVTILFEVLIQLGMIAIPLSYLQNTGWCLVDRSEKKALPSGMPLQFRVSHLLLLNVLVALILVIRKFVHSTGTILESGAIGFQGDTFSHMVAAIAVIGVNLLLMSTAVVTGFWACLGPHPPGYRLSVSLVSVALLCAFPLHIAGGYAQVQWTLAILTFMAVVILSLLLLRYLGVRLVKFSSYRDYFSSVEGE